jgi:hypothetical protein
VDVKVPEAELVASRDPARHQAHRIPSPGGDRRSRRRAPVRSIP